MLWTVPHARSRARERRAAHSNRVAAPRRQKRRAGRRRELAGEHLERGGLSRAIDAEKTENFAGRYAERYAANRIRRDAGVPFANVANDQTGKLAGIRAKHPRALRRHAGVRG